MRRLAILSSAVLLIILLVAAPAAAEVTKTLRAELSPKAGAAWGVENLAGRMKVVHGSGSAVVAVATIHAESQELADSLKLEEVSITSGTGLRMRYPVDDHTTFKYPVSSDGHHSGVLSWLGGDSNSNFKYDGHQVKVSSKSGVLLYADIEVQIPSKLAGKGTFENHVGMIEGRGVDGNLVFSTASGDVDLDKVSGEIKVDTGSGDVSNDGGAGSLSVDTGSGDIKVEHFSGDKIDCDVGSGDVTLTSGVSTSVSVDTGSGDVELSSMDIEEFKGDTGSGDVTVESHGNRLTRIVTETGSGDVVLRLGGNASFELLADQGSGDLVSHYSDAQPIVKGREVIGYRRGDSRSKITVSTGSGDVTVEPGASI
ncbi:MAG TPA: DUF4097 family beta strand repeat-containing protein [Candidatus Polarisedimenticolia bacterium]|nr:DUF4097 family beta strand repeat-containing protein [Candidatus Polarisedimenticolia bacterium]